MTAHGFASIGSVICEYGADPATQEQRPIVDDAPTLPALAIAAPFLLGAVFCLRVVEALLRTRR